MGKRAIGIKLFIKIRLYRDVQEVVLYVCRKTIPKFPWVKGR